MKHRCVLPLKPENAISMLQSSLKFIQFVLQSRKLCLDCIDLGLVRCLMRVRRCGCGRISNSHGLPPRLLHRASRPTSCSWRFHSAAAASLRTRGSDPTSPKGQTLLHVAHAGRDIFKKRFLLGFQHTERIGQKIRNHGRGLIGIAAYNVVQHIDRQNSFAAAFLFGDNLQQKLAGQIFAGFRSTICTVLPARIISAS